MKKTISVFLVITMMLSASACTRFFPTLGKLSEIRNKIAKTVSAPLKELAQPKEQKNDSGVPEENLLDKIQGYWIVKEAFERPTDHEFWYIQGDTIRWGFYESEWGRQGLVTNVEKTVNETFGLSIYYPAEPANDMYEAMPEDYGSMHIRSDDNFEKTMYFMYSDGTEAELVFAGTTEASFYSLCNRLLGYE